jgi:hypothetical protein
VRQGRKKIVLGVVSVVVLAGALAAYGLWAGSGTGSGRARAATAVSAIVNPLDCSATPGCIGLYPGYTQGDVYFTITNPNPYPIIFTEMTPGAITVAASPGCPPGSITVAPATGLSLLAPANSTTGELSISDVVSMSVDAANACQGASYEIAMTLTGEQSP